MDEKTNVIYLFADQLAYNRVGYNGDTLAETPNIDSFCKSSCNMENAVSGHPVCAPYRASLLTGKYTTSTGMVINEIRINPCHVTLPKVLTQHGYETCYIGKWHMYAAQLGNHYDVKNSYIPRGEDRLGFDDFFAGYNFHHEYYSPQAYYHLDSEEKHYVDGYEPDAQTDMAIEQLTRLSQGEKPFAFFLSLGTPHDPWTKENVPEEYYRRFADTQFPLAPNYSKHNDKYADFWARFMPGERKKLNEWLRCYYAMVANLDYNIGRLMAAIKRLGLEENSIIVFTSDHGELFGAHGRRAKNIFYDEAVRVPFLMKWGNRLPMLSDECFATVDVMPTLLSFLGLPIPKDVEGEDKSTALLQCADCINGSAAQDGLAKADSLAERSKDEQGGSLLMGTGMTAMWGNGAEWRGYRTARYTYAVYRRDNKELLFDNIADKYQMNNLAQQPQYGALKGRLRANMLKKMEQIGDDFEKTSFYKKYWVEDRIIKAKLPRRKDIN